MNIEHLFAIEGISTDFLRRYLKFVELGATPDFLSCLAEILREYNVEIGDFEEMRNLVLKRCREFFLDQEFVRQCRINCLIKFSAGKNHIEAKTQAMAEMAVPEIFRPNVVAAMFPEEIPRGKSKLAMVTRPNRRIHLVVNNRPDWRRFAGNDRDD